MSVLCEECVLVARGIIMMDVPLSYRHHRRRGIMIRAVGRSSFYTSARGATEQVLWVWVLHVDVQKSGRRSGRTTCSNKFLTKIPSLIHPQSTLMSVFSDSRV